MLESNVVFGPRLRGTEQKALCPRRDQARSADSEVLAPVSSTKTKRFGSICAASVTLQGALQPFVSLQRPHTPFFGLKPILLSSRPTVESLKTLPVTRSKKRRLSTMVAAGRSLTSSPSSSSVARSVFGGLPPPFLGWRDSPPTGDPRVAFDRGETDVEEASDPGLGHAVFDGSYDPRAQIFRVWLHAPSSPVKTV